MEEKATAEELEYLQHFLYNLIDCVRSCGKFSARRRGRSQGFC
jgi:hypothetical protein